MNGALAQSLRDDLPNLLGAIPILVGGVLVAWLIPRMSRATLLQVGLDKRMACCVGAGQPVIGDPLINLLRTLFGYIPRLLTAVGLVALACSMAVGDRIVTQES